MLFKISRLPGVAKLHPWVRGRDNNSRFLPVNADIETPEGAPLPIELLYRLINEASHRMVIDYCACRKACGCRKYDTDIGCLVLGDSGLEIARSVSREVTPQEARKYTNSAVAQGLIPFVGKIRMDNLLYGIRDVHKLLTVCYCRECCCVARFTRHIPMEHLEPAYTRLAGVEILVGEECTGCGKCADACFMQAIEVVGERATINEYCRACGRCATVCPSDAIKVRLTDATFLEDAYRQIGARVSHT